MSAPDLERKSSARANEGRIMWQPDGWAQTRIGVLTPHADVVPETEFGALAPDGISIHAMRVPFGAYKVGGAMDRTIADDPVRAFAEPPLVDDAAEVLAAAPLHASVCFGFEPGRRARCRRNRARRHAIRARLEWRRDRDGKRNGGHSSPNDHRACGQASATRGLLGNRRLFPSSYGPDRIDQ